MNTINASEPGLRVIDWKKLLNVALDHPVQTSFFVITFAFLLFVEPPVPLSLFLLSTLVYFIFAFGEQSSRVENKAVNVSALTEEPTTPRAPAVAEKVLAENAAAAPVTAQETTRSPARRSTRRASESQRSQANPQRSRQRTSRNPK
ncbi:conserved protein of unknown function [Methylocaldum szegediense]|uniref:Uncharacterized protein n=1 Tax=Methylocaldum szegediense TaxID=73780 RepID=A0ABM9I8E0_9GAMM|nr:conserved protein of unknown function [Methylocaldum szegediense]